MKLKEKLAKEVITFNTPGSYQHESEMKRYLEGIEVGYLAGFEKARELSIEKCKDWVGEDHYLINYDLKDLGEEEVN
jgi:hypothetical protein